jgi:transcriptional regulator with XRE-family HTH domain
MASDDAQPGRGRRVEPQPGLGAAIRQLRQAREMSQEALGERAGIHSTWISHIESGRINATWGNVRKIAYALDIELAELAALAERLETEHADAST